MENAITKKNATHKTLMDRIATLKRERKSNTRIHNVHPDQDAVQDKKVDIILSHTHKYIHSSSRHFWDGQSINQLK